MAQSARYKRQARDGYIILGAVALGFTSLIGGAAYLDSHRDAPATYAVILTVASGNEYVVDYGMTQEDCADAIVTDWPDATCTIEGSN